MAKANAESHVCVSSVGCHGSHKQTRQLVSEQRNRIIQICSVVIGNPVHDLIRLDLSLATAARGSDFNRFRSIWRISSRSPYSLDLPKGKLGGYCPFSARHLEQRKFLELIPVYGIAFTRGFNADDADGSR